MFTDIPRINTGLPLRALHRIITRQSQTAYFAPNRSQFAMLPQNKTTGLNSVNTLKSYD